MTATRASAGTDADVGRNPRDVTAPGCAGVAARVFRPASVEDRGADQRDRKFIVCNADEGDSGTFADRMIWRAIRSW